MQPCTRSTRHDTRTCNGAAVGHKFRQHSHFLWYTSRQRRANAALTMEDTTHLVSACQYTAHPYVHMCRSRLLGAARRPCRLQQVRERIQTHACAHSDGPAVFAYFCLARVATDMTVLCNGVVIDQASSHHSHSAVCSLLRRRVSTVPTMASTTHASLALLWNCVP